MSHATTPPPPLADASTSGARAPALGFILVTVLLETLGFGLLIPVSPKLIQGLLGTHTDQSGFAVAALTATFSLMLLLFSPALGALSDKVGRRPVLLVSMFGSGLDYFAMALAPTLWVLFLTRAINGISGATFTVANAYVADVTPREKRAGAFGMLFAAFGLGFVLGPLAGGLLGERNIHWPFYAAGALSLVNWLYGFFVLPESLPRERRREMTWARANPVGSFLHLSGHRLTFGLAMASFFASMAQYALHVVWALYTERRYGWTPRAIGLSLFLVGITTALVQGGLTKKVIGVIGERRALIFGMGVGMLAFIGYGSATQGWMIYAILSVASIGGVGSAAAQALVTKSVRPDEQGSIQGAMTSLAALAQILAPLASGTLFDLFAGEKAIAHVPGMSFYMSAALTLIAIAIAWTTFSRHPEPPAPAA